MRRSGIRLGRVFGVQVSADFGVLVIGALLAWILATTILPDGEPGLTGSTYWSVGLLGSLLFLISLLAHEVSHSVVARHDGIEVEGITLWMFGGVAQFRSEPTTAGSEFRIAAAGPAMSILLGGVFIAGAFGLDRAGVAGVYPAMLFWLGWINLFLGVFNLLPGAPLDGGRVLGAVIWRIRGDRVRAKIAAARCGRIVGILLIGAGLLELVAIGSFSGLWTSFIGWYLFSAARMEEAHFVGEQALGGVAVAAAMTRNPQVVKSWSTVRDLVDGPLRWSAQTAVPVIDVGGHLSGLATMTGVQSVPADAWSGTQVGRIAIPSELVPVVSATDPLMSVLERLRPESGGFAVVMDHGDIVGLLGPDDIQRAVARGRLGGPPPACERKPPGGHPLRPSTGAGPCPCPALARAVATEPPHARPLSDTARPLKLPDRPRPQERTCPRTST